MSLAGKRIFPLLDRILVSRIKPLEKTAAGILIPEKAQETLNRGRVLAVGPGSEEHKVTLKAGDEVILPAFGGTSLKNNKEAEEELFIFRESEILAKVSE